MRIISSLNGSQTEPNWEIDRIQFFFRVNFLHHSLSRCSVLPHDLYQTDTNDSDYKNDTSSIYRLMFMLVTEDSFRSPWGDELVKFLNSFFFSDGFGAPILMPASCSGAKCLVLPVLTPRVQAELSTLVPNWTLERICSTLCQVPINSPSGDAELFIRVPPLVKYIILARLGIVARVLVERNSLPATSGKDQYDCVTVTSLLLLHIKAIAIGLRLFVDRDGEGEWSALLDHLIAAVGESLFGALDRVLRSRGEWTSEILLTLLHTLCTDWVGLLPPVWATRMRIATETASAFHGSRPNAGLRSKQSWNWFGECTDDNWAERVRWLAALCEQQIDRRIVSVCVREEFAFIAENIPFILFRIVPRELLSLLQRALFIARETRDRRMLDDALQLVGHVLAITNNVLNKGLKRKHSNRNDVTWDDKSFSDAFAMSMPYFHHWCGFELGDDFRRLEYRPLPVIAESFKSILDLVESEQHRAPMLTELELEELSSDVAHFINSFRSTVLHNQLHLFTNFARNRHLHTDNIVDTTVFRALARLSESDTNKYSARSSDADVSDFSENEAESDQRGREDGNGLTPFSNQIPTCFIRTPTGISDLVEVENQFNKHLSKRSRISSYSTKGYVKLKRSRLESQSPKVASLRAQFEIMSETDCDTSGQQLNDRVTSTQTSSTSVLQPPRTISILELGASSMPSEKESAWERDHQEPVLPISDKLSESDK